MIKLTNNDYAGLERDLPYSLPEGSSFRTLDTKKFFIYGKDGKAEIVGSKATVESASGSNTIVLNGGSVHKHNNPSIYLADTSLGEITINVPNDVDNFFSIRDVAKNFLITNVTVNILDSDNSVIHTAILDKANSTFIFYKVGIIWKYSQEGFGEVIDVASIHKASVDFVIPDEQLNKFFRYDPLKDELIASRLLATELNSFRLGNLHTISSGDSSLFLKNSITGVDGRVIVDGVKDQSIAQNQDVTGLLPAFSRVYSDDLAFVDIFGAKDSSGVVDFNIVTTRTSNGSIHGIKITFEEEILPTDNIFYSVFDGNDSNGIKIFSQRTTGLTFSAGNDFTFWFENPIDGVKGTEICIMLEKASTRDGIRSFVKIRRSSSQPTDPYVQIMVRGFTDNLIDADITTLLDGTAEQVHKVPTVYIVDTSSASQVIKVLDEVNSKFTIRDEKKSFNTNNVTINIINSDGIAIDHTVVLNKPDNSYHFHKSNGVWKYSEEGGGQTVDVSVANDAITDFGTDILSGEPIQLEIINQTAQHNADFGPVDPKNNIVKVLNMSTFTVASTGTYEFTMSAKVFANDTFSTNNVYHLGLFVDGIRDLNVLGRYMGVGDATVSSGSSPTRTLIRALTSGQAIDFGYSHDTNDTASGIVDMEVICRRLPDESVVLVDPNTVTVDSLEILQKELNANLGAFGENVFFPLNHANMIEKFQKGTILSESDIETIVLTPGNWRLIFNISLIDVLDRGGLIWESNGVEIGVRGVEKPAESTQELGESPAIAFVTVPTGSTRNIRAKFIDGFTPAGSTAPSQAGCNFTIEKLATGTITLLSTETVKTVELVNELIQQTVFQDGIDFGPSDPRNNIVLINNMIPFIAPRDANYEFTIRGGAVNYATDGNTEQYVGLIVDGVSDTNMNPMLTGDGFSTSFNKTIVRFLTAGQSVRVGYSHNTTDTSSGVRYTEMNCKELPSTTVVPTLGVISKSGATATAAGASAGEQWITLGHATLPDGVIMQA